MELSLDFKNAINDRFTNGF